MALIPTDGHVVAHNGQIITFQVLYRKPVSDPAERNALVFSRKVFDGRTGRFLEVSGGEHHIPSSTLELVCVRCVADSRSGVILPCVLLRTCRRRTSASWRMMTLLLHPSDDLEPQMSFMVEAETLEDVHLADGPTVLWRQRERLLHVSAHPSEVVTAPVQMSAVLWVGATEEGTCIVGRSAVRSAGTSSPRSSLTDGTLQGEDFVIYCLENQKTTPGSHLLPHAYSSVLRCLEVYDMQNVNGRYEASAIAASGRQLICFHNGVPTRVYPLPAEDPSRLQVAFTSQSDVLCVLSFPSGDACAIWRDGGKTAATWHRVGHLLVDDFLGRGSDQLLVVFNDGPENCEQPAFRLTDCRDISYPIRNAQKVPVSRRTRARLRLPPSPGSSPSPAEPGLVSISRRARARLHLLPSSGSSPSPAELGLVSISRRVQADSMEDDIIGPQDNHSLMLPTLEARLQANLQSLEELQRHVQVQDGILESSCRALQDMSLGRETVVRSAQKVLATLTC